MKVDVANERAVIEGIKRADIAIIAAAREGIRKATSDLAADVIQHTPVKSGKARGSVVATIAPSGNSGRVSYDFRRLAAFYMRFLLRGVRKHPISTKYKSKRGMKAAQTRANKKAKKEGTVAPTITKKRSLAFRVGGKLIFRSNVPQHPGSKAKPILTDRLAANQGRIFTTIASFVAKRTGKVFG
jgi:hypothetical protein